MNATDIREAPIHELQRELRNFLRHARRYSPSSPIHADIQNKLIRPIKSEIARRNAEKVIS